MGVYALIDEEAQLGFVLISIDHSFSTSKLQSDHNTEYTAVFEHGIGVT